MENLIGRESEIAVLKEALESPHAELIAVYGRRRVGKTYLIQTVYEQNMLLELMGLNGVSQPEQLENFSLTIARTFDLPLSILQPQNWLQAFHVLIQILEKQLVTTPNSSKKVLFFDELPWFDAQKSGFVAAFDHFWNAWASKKKKLVVVICGSAASWMIQNIVRNKGGLHNRITRRIRLMPFNLYETALFLKKQYIELDYYQLLQLYMVTGGIPHYLKEMKRGESVTQTIDRLCFTNDGLLSNEFRNLYSALFGSSEKHETVIKALAHKPNGMTRNEIVTTCKLPSGGGLTQLLDELLESGFISEQVPFNKTVKDSFFKLTDEYSLFYLKFMDNSKAFGAGTWQSRSQSSIWKSWAGLAFENICLKHIPQIKKALGILGVYSEQSAWRHAPKDNSTGTQIDLLIDRQDNCINLCEMKFSLTEFTIDKKYAENLQLKKRIFLEKTVPKKTVFITMITTFGVKTNEHYLNTTQNQLKMEVLFEKL
ncbi:MAG: hypothetical protein RL329_3525 [Bacteroidota bacterium]|jgi:hypothetical protein